MLTEVRQKLKRELKWPNMYTKLEQNIIINIDKQYGENKNCHMLCTVDTNIWFTNMDDEQIIRM